MRVIIDECLPKRLIRELPGHDAVIVPMEGWAGIQNGELLRRISGRFEAFVTIDGNLAQQQNAGKLPFGKGPSQKAQRGLLCRLPASRRRSTNC